MKKERISINILVDRSGSMESCKSEMEKGLKEMIDKQTGSVCEKCTEVLFSLSQFDTEYEELFVNRKSNDIGEITITPRGWTALYDSLGKLINAVHERNKNKFDRTLFIIVTDGAENASKEYKSEDIKSLIQSKEKDGWAFLYVGANQDSFLVAKSIGINPKYAMNYVANADGIIRASKIMGQSISSYSTTGKLEEISDN